MKKKLAVSLVVTMLIMMTLVISLSSCTVGTYKMLGSDGEPSDTAYIKLGLGNKFTYELKGKVKVVGTYEVKPVDENDKKAGNYIIVDFSEKGDVYNGKGEKLPNTLLGKGAREIALLSAQLVIGGMIEKDGNIISGAGIFAKKSITKEAEKEYNKIVDSLKKK